MNNMERVREYINQLDDKTQELANKAIKDVRAEGFKWSWIITALEIKEPEEWEQWGFGLFFNRTFRAQVEKELTKSRRLALEKANVWVRDDDEVPTIDISIQANSDDMKTLDKGISALLSSIGLSWEDVLNLADKHIAQPEEAESAPKEVEKDYSDAPRWYDIKDKCWQDYDVSQFTDDTSIRNPRISMDIRNVDTIKYAFEKGDIPLSNRDYFQHLLDVAESIS